MQQLKLKAVVRQARVYYNNKMTPALSSRVLPIKYNMLKFWNVRNVSRVQRQIVQSLSPEDDENNDSSSSLLLHTFLLQHLNHQAIIFHSLPFPHHHHWTSLSAWSFLSSKKVDATRGVWCFLFIIQSKTLYSASPLPLAPKYFHIYNVVPSFHQVTS
jgi:hypothetical protein